MGSDNNVNIRVFDERGQLSNLSGWSIDQGNGTGPTGDGTKTLTPPTFTVTGNLLELTLIEPRSASEAVARSYVNRGYGTGIGQGTSGQKEWPWTIDVNENSFRSAHMCVNGDFQLPKKMNLYFPLTLTTPAGFAMKLLLGQSHEGVGFEAMMHALADAGKAVYKGCVAAEEENYFGMAMQTVQFANNIKNLFGGGNPWHVTVIGSEGYPAAAIPQTTVRSKAYNPSLLCVGPASAGKKQAGCFLSNPQAGPGDNNVFVLKIYDERPI